MSKLAWHSALLVAGKVFSGISSLAGGVVLARWLSINDYGTYSQLILICSTLVLFSNLSLQRSVYFFLPRSASKERKSVAIQILSVTIVSSLLFSFFLFWAIPFLADFMKNPEISSATVYSAVYLFCLSVSTLFEPFMVTLGYAKEAALIESIVGCGLFFSVLLPLQLGMNFRVILVCMSLVLLIKVAMVIYHIIHMDGVVTLQLLKKGLAQKLKYSAPLALGSMIGIVGRRIDQFIISYMFNPIDFAIYTRGAFELPLVAILPMTISNILLPTFSRDFAEGNTRAVAWQFADKARKVALLFFPLSVMMMVASEPFIVFLFSQKYIESVNIFRVYLLLLPIRITVYGIIIRASGNTQKFIVGDLLCVASNVLISIVLINIVGMTGAAWGTVLSIGLYNLYILKINSELLMVPIVKILPWHALGKIMLVSIVAGMVSSVIIMFVRGYSLQLFFVPIVFLAVYIVIGYWFDIYTKGDVDLFCNILEDKLNMLKKA